MKNIILLSFVSLILFSCAKKNPNDNSSSHELVGTWKTSCLITSDNQSRIFTLIFTNSERMRVRFDSSGLGSHEGNFGTWENTPKTLNLMTTSMIFKNNFGVGISTIDWHGNGYQNISPGITYNYSAWGVSGSFLNGYYVFEETNPNTYWIDDMPLSLTLGTSYPLSLEMKWGMGYKDDASLFSRLISIGVKVTDYFELILNGRYYGFTAQNGGRFNLTVNTLGIGYLF